MYEKRCRGIILRQIDLGEADLLVTCYTDLYGLLSLRAARAKKSKRRFGGLLQSFSVHHIAFQQRRNAFPVLLRLEMQTMQPKLRTDLAAFAAASFAAELTLRLMQDGDVNADMFELLTQFIEFCQEKELTRKAYCRFMLRFLELLGLQPDWLHCLECGKSVVDSKSCLFDFAYGGLRCQSCPAQHRAVRRIHEKLRNLSLSLQTRRSTADFSPDSFRDVALLLEKRFEVLCQGKLKSLEFLNEMASWNLSLNLASKKTT